MPAHLGEAAAADPAVVHGARRAGVATDHARARLAGGGGALGERGGVSEAGKHPWVQAWSGAAACSLQTALQPAWLRVSACPAHLGPSSPAEVLARRMHPTCALSCQPARWSWGERRRLTCRALERSVSLRDRSRRPSAAASRSRNDFCSARSSSTLEARGACARSDTRGLQEGGQGQGQGAGQGRVG